MKRWMLWVCGLLLLSGCALSPEPTPQGRTEGLFYEASGISPDAVLLTVDGRDVPAWRYFYWLTWGCDQLRTAYLDAGFALDWSETVEGTPLSEYVRQQALENTALYATVENWAETYGVTVTASDQDEWKAIWTAQAEEVGGEENYLALMAQRGLDVSEIEVLCQDVLRYRKLYQLFETPGSALAPAAGAVEAFAAEQGYQTIDWLMVPVTADSSRESCRQTASALFSQINESSEPLAVFNTLSETYGGDSGKGRTFLPDADVLPKTVQAAARSLDEGQWSGILEADDGFYILLCRPLDTSAVRADYFDDLLNHAAEQADIQMSDAYQALEAPAFYERLTAARAGAAESDEPQDS